MIQRAKMNALLSLQTSQRSSVSVINAIMVPSLNLKPNLKWSRQSASSKSSTAISLPSSQQDSYKGKPADGMEIGPILLDPTNGLLKRRQSTACFRADGCFPKGSEQRNNSWSAGISFYTITFLLTMHVLLVNLLCLLF